MDRIRKLSRRLQVVFWLGLVLLPLTAGLGWIFFDQILASDWGASLYPNAIPVKPEMIKGPVTGTVKLLGFAAQMIPAGIQMVILWLLIRLFGLYAEGQVFTAQNVRYIRRIGLWLILGQVAHPLYQGLISAILTMNNPPGQRMIRIGLSSTNISLVVVALMILVVAWIMDEGRRLKEEEALVI